MGDTTLTKLFVGGLSWDTKSDTLHSYFSQFGPINEAVVLIDKQTGRSKGYGFVTFADAAGAQLATSNPNPTIDGRRANCNLAALGAKRTVNANPFAGGGSFQNGGFRQNDDYRNNKFVANPVNLMGPNDGYYGMMVPPHGYGHQNPNFYYPNMAQPELAQGFIPQDPAFSGLQVAPVSNQNQAARVQYNNFAVPSDQNAVFQQGRLRTAYVPQMMPQNGSPALAGNFNTNYPPQMNYPYDGFNNPNMGGRFFVQEQQPSQYMNNGNIAFQHSPSSFNNVPPSFSPTAQVSSNTTNNGSLAPNPSN